MGEYNIKELRKFIAPEFVFGADSGFLAGQYAVNLSITKPLLVTGPTLRGHGVHRQIVESLEAEGVGHAIFSDVSPNPPRS